MNETEKQTGKKPLIFNKQKQNDLGVWWTGINLLTISEKKSFYSQQTSVLQN